MKDEHKDQEAVDEQPAEELKLPATVEEARKHSNVRFVDVEYSVGDINDL
jgi:hypothetical protein